MRRMLARLAEQGMVWRAGLEVEFHLFKYADRQPPSDAIAMPGPPPEVTPLNHGYQYLTELRYDALDPLLEKLRLGLQGLGLPLRSLEIEFGPSQVEVTFGTSTGMAAGRPDAAVPQRDQTDLRARGLPGELHVPAAVSACGRRPAGTCIIRSRTPRPAAICFRTRTVCRSRRSEWLGGLLRHARAAAAFSTPTINGYKRYRPQLHGAGSRRLGLRQSSGDGARGRHRRRSGDASGKPGGRAGRQSVSLHGLADRRGTGWRWRPPPIPGPSAEQPYSADAPTLPRSLIGGDRGVARKHLLPRRVRRCRSSTISSG